MVFVYKQDQYVPCYWPLRAYYGKDVNPNTGRRPIVFDIRKSFSGIGLELPCGSCVGCRLERARQWALRIMHEKRMHAESAFLTLTYREEDLPRNGTLVMRDLQLFMKRLRKQREKGLRFYACGEYGETTRRPHYHVLLLNTCFHDLKFWKMSGDHRLYVSAELSKLWTAGDHLVGDVSFGSAAYVARYCTKKIISEKDERGNDLRIPEFTCMSRKPGIGMLWLQKYGDEAYRHDSAIVDARQVALTRFYDDKYHDRIVVEENKIVRRRRAIVNSRPDRGIGRRLVLEKIAQAKLDRVTREK